MKPSKRKKVKVLIVDDEKIVVKGFQRELESYGFTVKGAIGGRAALEIINQERFHIVFTDLVMPEVSGVVVCRETKKIAPETEVVLISGHPSEILEFQKLFLDAGGRDAILRKPLLEEELTKEAEKIADEIMESDVLEDAAEGELSEASCRDAAMKAARGALGLFRLRLLRPNFG